ncbi:hypothetical protein [Photobacterium lutimaris]|uniref:Uncharacterized protein n=1 Tax=Photobacterium lutimaris TaxID=388278 RepID=A0A2T3ITN5_9GAMM|nr:hypothetical protein [Photobacterium lutimaris]PSU31726.1 hypothetical protein C9I99_21305 [Photobacterium lutimaris]TDR72634.1 hypothetical protein DFP78_113110 [Photobacterium lutimaris]
MTDKRWVFRELVKGDRHVEGLIAYALYKVEKDRLAERLRAEDKLEDEVEASLKDFHNQVLHSDRMQDSYLKEAVGIVYDSIQESIKNINADYARKESERKQEHDRAIQQLKAEKTKLINKRNEIPAEIAAGVEKALPKYVMKAAQAHNSHWFRRLCNWLVGGFAGYAAGLVIVSATVLFLFWSADKSDRDGLLATAYREVYEILIGHPPETETKVADVEHIEPGPKKTASVGD